jgi:S-formylglutathione hydrolase FrmB
MRATGLLPYALMLAMLGGAEAEKLTASLADEYELQERLDELGVPAEVFAPEKGHGFSYWKSARPGAMAFLAAHA